MHSVNVEWDDSVDDISDSALSDVDSADDLDSSIDVQQTSVEVMNTLKKQKQPTITGINSCNLSLPTRLLVLGPSGSGKTTAIRHLVKYFKSLGNVAGVWFFGASSDEEKWLPSQYRYQRVSKSKIEAIRKLQKTPKFKDYHQIIILDDILDTKFHSDTFWSHFVSTCRHQNITLIIGLQYLKGVPPIFRENISTYIICSSNNSNSESLYSLSRNPNKYKFKQLLSESKLVKGRPMVFSTIPGTQELTQISLSKLESQHM